MSTSHIMAREPAPTQAEKRDFISRAVHDLREPLRAIRASADLLSAAQAEPSGDVQNRCLSLIQSGVDTLEVLIEDLAEYCYGEAHELELETVPLKEALNEAQRQLFDLLKQTGASVTHDDLPTVRADGEELAAVFHHLLGNACKFRGEDPLRIHVGIRQGRGEWIVSVGDNGRGFDPRYKELIFKPFERLEGKQSPGSGLGLARARRAVARHGGRIWAESQPGEGTTIWFSLPSAG